MQLKGLIEEFWNRLLASVISQCMISNGNFVRAARRVQRARSDPILAELKSHLGTQFSMSVTHMKIIMIVNNNEVSDTGVHAAAHDSR